MDKFSDGKQGEPRQSQYTLCRDLFPFTGCSENWQRTGAIALEYKAAIETDGMMVIHVADHKTDYEYGPICFPIPMYNWFKVFVNQMRNKL